MKSKILHILGVSNYERKIFARKCYIHEISKEEKKNFLNEFHIQGNDNSNISLGLFEKETKNLVAVMTFSQTEI